MTRRTKSGQPTAGSGRPRPAADQIASADERARAPRRRSRPARRRASRTACRGRSRRSARAAASTSMTLFDFSSSRLESSIPARSTVSMKSRSWPERAVIARCRRATPSERSTSTSLSADRRQRRCPARGQSALLPRLVEDQRQLPADCGRPSLERAGQGRVGRARRSARRRSSCPSTASRAAT